MQIWNSFLDLSIPGVPLEFCEVLSFDHFLVLQHREAEDLVRSLPGCELPPPRVEVSFLHQWCLLLTHQQRTAPGNLPVQQVGLQRSEVLRLEVASLVSPLRIYSSIHELGIGADLLQPSLHPGNVESCLQELQTLSPEEDAVPLLEESSLSELAGLLLEQQVR